MADKEPQYTIYGETPNPLVQDIQSPLGGNRQPMELRELAELKAAVERLLHTMRIRYPIRSREELLRFVKGDRPALCHVRGKGISLRDLINSLDAGDFPIRSDHEAATLLAASCPVPARAAE